MNHNDDILTKGQSFGKILKMSDYEKIPQYLAGNILSLRKKMRLSQEQLAGLAEIPRSTLTHIESGSGNPSLQNLAKISHALQVGIEELLSRPRGEIELRREADIPVHRRSQGKVQVYKMLPDKIKGLEVDRVEIKAGATMAGHPHLAGAREYLTVTTGQMIVAVAGEQFHVKRGDVLAFPGDQPHSYRNDGQNDCVGISVVIPIALGMD